MFAAAPPSCGHDDDNDWLRVGRSFKKLPNSEETTRHDRHKDDDACAVQVYKKSKKSKLDKKKKKKKTKESNGARRRQRERDDSDASSDDDRAPRPSHKRKHSKSTGRKRSSSGRNGGTSPSSSPSSCSGSSGESSNSSDRKRRSKKRKRRDANASIHGPREESRRIVSTSNRQDQNDLALVDDPFHGEVEVYKNNGRTHVGVEKLFEYDCAGDRDNKMFGTLSRHDQPLYRLATRRSVVDGNWIVDRAKQTHHHSEPTKNSGAAHFQDRYFGGDAKKVAKRTSTKRLHLAYSQRRLARMATRHLDNKEELPFIPLDAIVDGELHELLIDEAKETEKEKKEGGDTATMLWQTDLENIEQFLVAKNKQLNERIHGDPHNIDAWLDLIAFQAQKMHRLLGKSLKKSQREEEASDENTLVMEKQNAVLAKALKENPQSPQLRQLALHLRWRDQQSQAANCSNRDLVEKMLEKDPTNHELWVQLIQCTQDKFGGFSMTMLRDLYARIMAVLNKELTRAVHTQQQQPQPPATSFIHVIGKSSLLLSEAADPYDATSCLDPVASALAASLVWFHQSMVQAEVSAGYTERAIAQVQAILQFNRIGIWQSNGSSSSSPPQQQQLLRPTTLDGFREEWGKETPRMGDTAQHEGNCPLLVPSPLAMASLCQTQVDHALHQVNPPLVIRSQAHMKSLCGPYDDYDDHDHSEDENDDNKSDDMTHVPQEADATIDDKASGQWVYSNLHGTRIWVATEGHTHERHEYERILNGLRGSESFQERQQTREQKQQDKQAKRRLLTAKLRDERAEFPLVSLTDDSFVQWFTQETHAQLTQWKPLRSSNAAHAALIECQPDRAILTEEILPFLFRVPRSHHLELVLNFLHVLGVPQQLQDPAAPAQGVAIDDLDGGLYGLLITPMLQALDASATSSIAMTSEDRLVLLMETLQRHIRVDAAALVDPDRIQFVRNVFASAISHSSTIAQQQHHQSQSDAVRLLKVLWIQYEAEIATSHSASEGAVDSFRSFCHGLLDPPADGEPVDAVLLSVYATAELRIGNIRQAARICDKTLGSLTTKGSDGVHRLLFLRIQLIFQPTGTEQLSLYQALYAAALVWRPEIGEPLDKLIKIHKNKPDVLLQVLQSRLDPIATELMETYRLQLDRALQQCHQAANHHQDHHHHRSQRLFCDVPFALHNLCVVIHATRGFHAAWQEYELFLTDGSPCHAYACHLLFLASLQRHKIHGQLPLVAPREWRRCVSQFVYKFPLDPLSLRLFVDAETSNTMSQTLRKYFQSRRDTWQRNADSPELVEWLFMLLGEFARAERTGSLSSQSSSSSTCCVLHRWGRNRPAVERIRRVFEEMLTQRKTSGHDLGWRLYLRFELAVGRVENAKKVFYRGLAKCPWSKALYMDAIALLRACLSTKECQEILDFMTAKELHIRVDES